MNMDDISTKMLLAALDRLLVSSGRMRMGLVAVFPQGKKDLQSAELQVDYDTALTFVVAAELAALELAKTLVAGQLTDEVLGALEHSERCAAKAAHAGRRLRQVAEFVATETGFSDVSH